MSIPRPRIVLVGPAGAGKTTLGMALAARLEVPLVQSDQWIEQHAGQSIDQLIISQDPRFPGLQRQAGLALLGGEDFASTWIAELGPSLPLDFDVFQALSTAHDQGSLVVEVSVSLAQASKRLGFNMPHQVSLGAPRAQLHRMMDQLHQRVASLVDLTVEGAGSAEAHAWDVVEAL